MIFRLAAEVPAEEEDVVILVEVELGVWRTVKEIVAIVVMVVVEVDSENTLCTTDPDIIESEEV